MTDFPEHPTIPHSIEAEEGFIGSILILSSRKDTLSIHLPPEAIYTHRLRWIWEAAQEICNDNMDPDPLTITDRLDGMGKLAEIGGASYLTELVNQVPTAMHIHSYVQIILDHWQRRKGIKVANEIANSAYNESVDFDLNSFGIRLAQMTTGKSHRSDANEAADKAIDAVTATRFFSIGVNDVDLKIGGLFPQELSLWGGYQGTGKSAAKSQAARENADKGKKVVCCDLEMSEAQTWLRMACGDLGVDINHLRSGRLSDSIVSEVTNKAGKLGDKYKGKIITWTSPMTPADILSAALMDQPDIIFIDTLKNISGMGTNVSKQIWYDYVCNFLRLQVAQPLDCHVALLHHIGRSATRERRKPTMHDLMYAGESDADMVLILYRKPEDYDVAGEQLKTIVPIEWIIGKSRFGWTGSVETNFNLPKQEFFGMTNQEEKNGWSHRKDIN